MCFLHFYIAGSFVGMGKHLSINDDDVDELGGMLFLEEPLESMIAVYLVAALGLWPLVAVLVAAVRVNRRTAHNIINMISYLITDHHHNDHHFVHRSIVTV